MKKLSLFVVALLAIIGTTQAQEAMLGAKAGLNLSNIVSDENADFDNAGGLDDNNTLTSFHLGLTGDVKISDTFGIGAEALYSRQGSKYEGGIFDGETRLNYINIPILAKFYVNDAFNIYGGVQPGFLVNAESEGNVLGFEGETDLKEEDVVKDNDFSIPVGLGYRADNGLSFDARYNIGTTAVFEGQDDDSDEVGKNRVLQVGIGFNF